MRRRWPASLVLLAVAAAFAPGGGVVPPAAAQRTVEEGRPGGLGPPALPEDPDAYAPQGEDGRDLPVTQRGRGGTPAGEGRASAVAALAGGAVVLGALALLVLPAVRGRRRGGDAAA